MVSDPHEYITPEQSRSYESPLWNAMKRCVDAGSLRRKVLEDTILPYYLRTPRDVRDALALAQELESEDRMAPIHALEIVEIRQYETLTGEIILPTASPNSNTSHHEHSVGVGVADADGMKGARDLFWAI